MSIPFVQRLTNDNPLYGFFGEFMPAPAPDIEDESYGPKVSDIIVNGGQFVVDIEAATGDFVLTVMHGTHKAAEVRIASAMGSGEYSDEKENTIDTAMKRLVDEAEAHFAGEADAVSDR